MRSPGCLILTCRTEGVAERPEVRRVLAALPRECVVRVAPEPLSETAVALLADRAGRKATDLHAVSGGNPFYVTEVLAASAGGGVPASVRDAVALRVDGVSPAARAVVELAAVVPGATELWLFGETVGADAGAIDECIAAGLLTLRGDTVAFRHDLARRAVEDDLSPVRRRELDGLVLGALAADGDADPARLAHHARRAGEVDAIRRLAPAAARAASRSGGHRQALEHWEAALAAEEGADPAVRVEALEGVAVEAYLCGHMARAIEARRALLAIHEAAGDALRVGDDLRWLSRLLWWSGRGEEAVAAGDRSIAVLEALPDSRELAMALSGRAQLAMLDERHDEAVALGTRAERLARRIGDDETVAHALTNVGSALTSARGCGAGPGPAGGGVRDRGRLRPRRPRRPRAGQPRDGHARCSTAKTRASPATSTAACASRSSASLDGYVQYLLGARAGLRLLRGEWPAAEADAHAALELGEQPGVSVCPALHRARPAARPPRRSGRARDHRQAWRVAVATVSCSGSRRSPRPGPSTRGSTATSPASSRPRARSTRSPSAAATCGRAASSPGGCGGRARR